MSEHDNEENSKGDVALVPALSASNDRDPHSGPPFASHHVLNQCVKNFKNKRGKERKYHHCDCQEVNPTQILPTSSTSNSNVRKFHIISRLRATTALNLTNLWKNTVLEECLITVPSKYSDYKCNKTFPRTATRAVLARNASDA